MLRAGVARRRTSKRETGAAAESVSAAPAKDNSTFYFFAGEAVAAGLAAAVAAGVGVALAAAFEGS